MRNTVAAVAIIIFILWSPIIICRQHHFVVTLDTWVRLSLRSLQIITGISFSYNHLISSTIISIRQWLCVRVSECALMHEWYSASKSSFFFSSVSLKQWQLFHVVIFLHIVIICGYEKKKNKYTNDSQGTEKISNQRILYDSKYCVFICSLNVNNDNLCFCVCVSWFTWMISFSKMSALFFLCSPWHWICAFCRAIWLFFLFFRLKFVVILQFDNAVLILARIDFKPINEFNKTNILFGLW